MAVEKQTRTKKPRVLGVALERRPPVRLGPHPERSLLNFRRWAGQLSKPRAVDLFSGCGGLSLGLEAAGYDVILAVDHDKWALETHQHNFKGVTLDIDLATPGGVEQVVGLLRDVEVDLIAGGPPCQPFSRAGKSKIRSLVDDGTRHKVDLRRELWRSFLQVVEEVRPRAVLMENVPDMALGDDLVTVRHIAQRLEAAGYEVDFNLLEAWRHGVPQHRERFFLVGIRDGVEFQWPKEADWVDVRDAIGDLPPLGTSTGEMSMPIGPAKSAFQRKMRLRVEDPKIVWDHVTRPVRDDDRIAFDLMKPGTKYDELPANLRRYRSDIFTDKYNRLSWTEVSRSITAHLAKDGYWYIHPEESRTLTVREAARIQTFPDRFRFAGARSHAFQQIGNAVPPVLAAAIAASILTATIAAEKARTPRVGIRRNRIRSKLLQWARQDARRNPWRHPGDPWVVLAGLIIGARGVAGDRLTRDFLKAFPTMPDLSEVPMQSARSVPWNAAALSRLRQVANKLRRVGGSWQRLDWAKAAGLASAEADFFRVVGLGQDAILANAPALRVVARLTERAVDKGRRLSDGKVALARLIGVGEETPRLAAALIALGSQVCTSADPKCIACPLHELCPSVGGLGK